MKECWCANAEHHEHAAYTITGPFKQPN